MIGGVWEWTNTAHPEHDDVASSVFERLVTDHLGEAHHRRKGGVVCRGRPAFDQGGNSEGEIGLRRSCDQLAVSGLEDVQRQQGVRKQHHPG